MNARERIAERMKDWTPPKRGDAGSAWRRAGVGNSRETSRILHLPRRTWSADDELSALLRLDPAQSLRPIQAAGLAELALVGGLVAMVEVGGGKTLLSFLSAYIVDAKRPVLVVPAKLRDKTRREFATLARSWRHEVIPEIVSYEWLGRENAAEWLEKFDPDLVILDEAHKAKNKRAAVTRRLARLRKASPSTRWVIMSGTFLRRSIDECAHLYEWALAERSPLPREYSVITEWSTCIDEEIPNGVFQRLSPGALTQLFDETEATMTDELAATRSAVRRRITETPGVIATSKTRIDASLIVEQHVYDETPPAVIEALAMIRDGWQRPDGEPFAEAATRWRHSIEAALGFYYRYDPEPPIEWRTARRAWTSVVRHVLDHNRRNLDSELQVTNAVRRGEYRGERAISNGIQLGLGTIEETYEAWSAMRPTFTPNQVAVWIDEGFVRWLMKRAAGQPAIVWCSHIALAEKLSSISGLPYYHEQGLDARGRPIESARPADGSIIASIASSGEGRNLQAWSRSIVVPGTIDGKSAEQLLGRMHRPGQRAEEVVYEWVFACAEQVDAFNRARLDDVPYIERMTGAEQKLGYCDVIETKIPTGPRWVGLKQRNE